MSNKKPKVLIVEDDVELADLFKRRLEAEGFSVTECDTGEQALQAGRGISPDLILLDLMMPKMDGFSTLDLFRHTPETQKAKIVVMSALNMKADIDRAMSLGADDYIVKSQVVIGDVMNRLRALLGMPPSALSEQNNTE